MALPQYLNTEASDRLITEVNDPLIGERSLAPYKGYNVFDLPLNWADNPRERIIRGMTTLENVTGLQKTRSHTATPVPRFDVTVTLEGRDAINEFRSWLRSFRGRQIPVWVPTWHRDLEPTASITGTALTIESIGYSGYLWPHYARRHIAVIDYDGTITPVGISPTPSDNGTTESLTLFSNIGTHTLGQFMVSFLVLARLQTDSVKLDWFGHSLAEARIGWMEVPREAPVP